MELRLRHNDSRPRGKHLTTQGGLMKDLNERGLENQVKGTGKEMKGQIRGDLGDATDNASEHIKGRAEEMKGKVQKDFGKAERDADSDNI